MAIGRDPASELRFLAWETELNGCPTVELALRRAITLQVQLTHDDVLAGGKTSGSMYKSNAGSEDSWLAKFSGLNGSKIWGMQIGSADADEISAIAVDKTLHCSLRKHWRGHSVYPARHRRMVGKIPF